jgi:hypothetical protein
MAVSGVCVAQSTTTCALRIGCVEGWLCGVENHHYVCIEGRGCVACG